jgi:hypothetical protein
MQYRKPGRFIPHGTKRREYVADPAGFGLPILSEEKTRIGHEKWQKVVVVGRQSRVST